MESNPTKPERKPEKPDKKRLRELETENHRLRREVARLRVRLNKAPPVTADEGETDKKGDAPGPKNPNTCECGAELITGALGPKTLKKCKVCGFWAVT